MSKGFEVILCIVNAGYTDLVMDTAKKLGARGGTVLHARGTASKDAEKIYNIPIQPEKEIVMILVDSKIKDAILHGIYDECGTSTPAQGIAFSLPVDDVVGINTEVNKEKKSK